MTNLIAEAAAITRMAAAGYDGSCRLRWQLPATAVGLDGESLKPVGVLRIAAAKCKNCIGKPILPVAERANADHHGAIAPLLKRELVVGKRCRFVQWLHRSAITKEDACSGEA